MYNEKGRYPISYKMDGGNMLVVWNTTWEIHFKDIKGGLCYHETNHRGILILNQGDDALWSPSTKTASTAEVNTAEYIYQDLVHYETNYNIYAMVVHPYPYNLLNMVTYHLVPKLLITAHEVSVVGRIFITDVVVIKVKIVCKALAPVVTYYLHIFPRQRNPT